MTNATQTENSSSIRRIFLREIRVLGKLRHPNIVAIIGAGIPNRTLHNFILSHRVTSLNDSEGVSVFNYLFSVTERGSEMLIMELMVMLEFFIYWKASTLRHYLEIDFWLVQENGSLYSLIHNDTIPIERGLAAQLLLDVSLGNKSSSEKCRNQIQIPLKFLAHLKFLDSGIRYLHSLSPPICHADLRSSNILWGIVSFTNGLFVLDQFSPFLATKSNQTYNLCPVEWTDLFVLRFQILDFSIKGMFCCSECSSCFLIDDFKLRNAIQ